MEIKLLTTVYYIKQTNDYIAHLKKKKNWIRGAGDAFLFRSRQTLLHRDSKNVHF